MENAWMKARLALLEKERALTRMIDQITEERLRLPRERMGKAYFFEGGVGKVGAADKVGLAELFGGKPKLIVQHFMFAPDWEEGCPGCSLAADCNQGILPHLAAQGYAFAAISLAPVTKLDAFKKRMGWKFNWVSSGDSDFDYDFEVARRGPDLVVMPGMSLFEKGKDGEVLRVWSGYGREAEQLIPSLVSEDFMNSVKLRDKYAEQAASCCHGVTGGITV